MANASTHWTKTQTGYCLEGGPVDAELARVGSRWVLRSCGREVDLGRRATFDTAEAALGNLLH